MSARWMMTAASDVDGPTINIGISAGRCRRPCRASSHPRTLRYPVAGLRGELQVKRACMNDSKSRKTAVCMFAAVGTWRQFPVKMNAVSDLTEL